MKRGNEEKTTYLHYSGSFNSTKFTDCCGLAVTRDQNRCPGCGAKVIRNIK
jgi:hypothetical protein